MRILLAEDDKLLGDAVRTGLAQSGFVVDWVHDGPAALHAARTEPYDLLLLDLGLPGCDGLEVLAELRRVSVDLPVLILTARDAVIDRVAGLDRGADDYLVKPFDLDELAARCRALVRRHAGRTAPTLTHGELQLDPAARIVSHAGRAVSLSPREFMLLQMLLENRGRVLSRQRLEEGLYGWGEEIESNAIEVHVHHLRRKFGRELIRTVRGVGYVIDRAD